MAGPTRDGGEAVMLRRGRWLVPGHVPGCATQCMRYSEALPRLKDWKRYPDTNSRLPVTKPRANLRVSSMIGFRQRCSAAHVH